MISNESVSSIGSIQVLTTEGRGFTPEEIAERAVSKIIHVGQNSHPLLIQQAEAFRDDIKKVIVFYMHEAVRSHNVTLANRFNSAGHPELIKLLES